MIIDAGDKRRDDWAAAIAAMPATTRQVIWGSPISTRHCWKYHSWHTYIAATLSRPPVLARRQHAMHATLPKARLHAGRHRLDAYTP